MKRIVVVLSGGMDSTALLYEMIDRGYECLALSVDYGQRHRKELECAAAICRVKDIPHQIADLTSLRSILGGSSLTDDSIDVPHGHYEAESMKATVVPNRNMILLAVAGGFAVANKCEAVAYAAHAGDHAIYPDCRTVFRSAMDTALRLCSFDEIGLMAPFVQMTKADIVHIGHDLLVPWDMTWTCYEGNEVPCGLCGTCVERILAFEEANFIDPVDYGQSWEETCAKARKATQ